MSDNKKRGEVFLFTTDEPDMRGFTKLLQKKVAKVHITGDPNDGIDIMKQIDVLIFFVNADIQGSEPMAKYIKTFREHSYMVLVSNRSDQQMIDKYMANAVISKNASAKDIDGLFPVEAAVKEPVEDDPDLPAGEPGILLPMPGVVVAGVEKAGSDGAVALAKPYLDEVQDEKPELEAIKGSRRVITFPRLQLPKFKLEPKEKNPPKPAKVKKVKEPRVKPGIEDAPVSEEVPELALKTRRTRTVYVAVGLLALLAILALVVKTSSPGNTKNIKSTKATVGEKKDQKKVAASSPQSSPAVNDQGASPALSGQTSSPSGNDQPAPTPTPTLTPTPTPPPAPVHPRPTVSISGPSVVTAYQTYTYTASASGEGISYSWGGSSTERAWQVPGQVSVSVTVTDQYGQTASDSISVEVRN